MTDYFDGKLGSKENHLRRRGMECEDVVICPVCGSKLLISPNLRIIDVMGEE